ncbi:hypothetical protein N0O92_13660 [Alkalihalobacillus sp. MEB130]|uniref:hypothetical protein n=1 Tax=Alkalihalobacillus sp. MEB130 TaxID=2976704 RepID=UPI0028DFC312|nr:hypothetical protein [Alkalihalobacillus sp. MEB130]MDT8861281.1 hypothetical protein [Alkalihalobacillus sp. MEB130]
MKANNTIEYNKVFYFESCTIGRGYLMKRWHIFLLSWVMAGIIGVLGAFIALNLETLTTVHLILLMIVMGVGVGGGLKLILNKLNN